MSNPVQEERQFTGYWICALSENFFEKTRECSVRH